MKISIVTPSSNAARFIREAMTSVVTQSGDFRIEYIVVDNASNDGTREIVETFQDALASGRMPLSCTAVELVFVSEPDNGMYDAIGKGFAIASAALTALALFSAYVTTVGSAAEPLLINVSVPSVMASHIASPET